MSAAGFDRSRRLLAAAQFEAVFGGAEFRFAHRNFLVLARRNGLGHPRLGLVVGKKSVRGAVRRNRVKRVVRESFRRHQPLLDSLDVVFLARRGFDELEAAEQRNLLAEAWHHLARRLQRAGREGEA